MKKKPLVSFCLFCYNQEEFVKEAIEGALSQSYSPLEIIISDDCSTDNTFEIINKEIKNYSGPHKVIVNRNNENLGLVEHVNQVLYNTSKGDYVAIAAGDDVSLANRVEISIDYLERNKDIDILSSSLLCIDSNSEIVENERFNFDDNNKLGLDYFLLNSNKHINAPSRVISRKLINAFPPLNNNAQTEDTTFLFRAFLFSKVGVLKEKLVKYRVHDNSLSSKEGLKKFDIEKIFDQYKDDLVLSINKYIDESEYRKIEKSLEVKYNKRKGITLKNNDRHIVKRIVYRILNIFFKNYYYLINTWFNEERSLKELFLNIFNSIFPRKNTVCLGGSTFSKNFGDALNVVLLQQLFGNNYFENIFVKSDREELLMIGSILHKATSKSIIWGAGYIEENAKITVPQKIYAVRGPLTRDVLLKNNVECPEVYGDPALLLPLFYKSKSEKKYKYGILPHYIDKHHKVVRDFSKRSDVKYINIEQGYQNWKSFIDELTECEVVISSSLHGVILSDAYNIPNIWAVFTDNVTGDGFKFRDYYSSVGKQVSVPLDLKSEINESLITIKLNEWKPIRFDYKPLLNAFPYKLKENL